MASFTWKSREALDAEAREAQVQALRDARDQALRETDWTQLPDAPLTPEEVADSRELRAALRGAPEQAASAPAWAPDTTVAPGALQSHGGVVYACLQAHTTQADWTPDQTRALWRRLGPVNLLQAGQPRPWRQPQGAHDAYQTGDRVTYEGQVYESLIDGNVYSPTAYPQGWQLIE